MKSIASLLVPTTHGYFSFAGNAFTNFSARSIQSFNQGLRSTDRPYSSRLVDLVKGRVL
jgi:hypothetical protein